VSRVLAAFCAFIVGAVRSAAPATVFHPAGDIALVAASSLLSIKALPSILSICATSCTE
jgi:hypothetical protein